MARANSDAAPLGMARPVGVTQGDFDPAADSDQLIEQLHHVVGRDRAVERTVERGRQVKAQRGLGRKRLDQSAVLLDRFLGRPAHVVEVVLLARRQDESDVGSPGGDRFRAVALVRHQDLRGEPG